MIRNVALAMVTEVFTPVEVARNARLENTVEVHVVGGRGVDPSPDRIPRAEKGSGLGHLWAATPHST
jgi:hypothetical protein